VYDRETLIDLDDVVDPFYRDLDLAICYDLVVADLYRDPDHDDPYRGLAIVIDPVISIDHVCLYDPCWIRCHYLYLSSQLANQAVYWRELSQEVLLLGYFA
jgi:hypothetical protein